MHGEVIKELAERLRGPHTIGDLIVAPGDWRVHDPAEHVKPAPAAKAFSVATLGAVRDYLVANRDGLPLDTLVVHVEGPNRVTVGGPLRERSRDRELYVTAVAQDLTDSFLSKWMALEEFVIGLQVRFCDADDRAHLLRLLSNVSGETVKTSLDDGVSQVLEAKLGVVLRGDAAIKNPVHLTAFRTFRDIVQPSSPYVLRVKGGEGLPQVALMEADGGAWKLSAVARIRDWLVESLPAGIAVLA